MATTTPSRTRPAASTLPNSLTAGKLHRFTAPAIFVVSWLVMAAVFLVLELAGAADSFNVVGTAVFGTLLFGIALFCISLAVEGERKAKDRVITILVTVAFVLALIPLVSLVFTAVTNGSGRFDPLFFNSSLRNVVGEGGGGLHAIVGTLIVTAIAAVISIPVGLMAAIYLVEYGRGRLARAITFFVDVMTGIPSIVAGLFAYALLVIFLGPGIRLGFGGALALSVLMIPVVVRSAEEMLKLVPNELREASYALGVPKWLTIVKIVLPTSLAGIVTGVMLAIARVIGETAPLLIVAGFTQSMNYNPFKDQMMTLPVFVFRQYADQGSDAFAYVDRAWTGALVLILIVMVLNIVARLIARIFAPKLGR
ncbi:phosphate ABC transporter permease PstA [Clavibacter michiganensis subsp. phaseoli]|jgi:phosphate transport system permease protein|uniref:Phosphate transport system permease protein PstA n=1 Tax=Clavibacter phaseoli TaxID=1734031 RepID=A0A8I0VE33_9MICO|nr:phosphate ABC transporter permease PstA [Clavibacter phaseoli]MBF4632535.1 phosphate ABC transporter permease PstA [Clavibacter phaseoli]